MKNVIAALLGLIILSACSSSSLTLEDYPEITHFSPTEKEDLTRIVDFMDRSVCQPKNLQLKQCYQTFFASLPERTAAGEISIPFSAQELAILFAQIDSETIQSIWTSETQSTGSVPSNLQISYEGKFGEFVRKYAEENATANVYYELLSSTGHVSAARFIDHLTSTEVQELALEDERLRLLIAVQFITMSR